MTNVLVIVADEHRPDTMGCAGHETVETPHIDSIAASGARFTNAYCTNPLCIPSRSSMFTGRYVHETECWDNNEPWDGTPRGWSHRLNEAGVSVPSFGRLHIAAEADHGFDSTVLPCRGRGSHTKIRRLPRNTGQGGRERTLLHAGPHDRFKDDPGLREETVQSILTRVDRDRYDPEADPTVSDSHSYDERRTAAAVDWLEEHATSNEDWAMWLGFYLPHFPFTVESEFYDRYPRDQIELPIDSPPAETHPMLEQIRSWFNCHNPPEDAVRRARAAYYGMCTRMDRNVGRVLEALERTDQADDTIVIYTADHGEMLGDHELWRKNCMYEPSVRVPLVIQGPNIDPGTSITQPVSLVDLARTMADATGVDPDPDWHGESWLPLARGERTENPDRVVFSEHHGPPADHAMYMIRRGRYKYIHYPFNHPQLFDLEADPDETTNLAETSDHAGVQDELEAKLNSLIDPQALDVEAKMDQIDRYCRQRS